MSTLAHEGNPKEASIVIAVGDVLSTAQLDIDFQFFGPLGPNLPDTNNDLPVYAGCTYSEEFRFVEDCELGLRIVDRYDFGSYAPAVKLHGKFTGCSGTPAGGFVFQPTTTLFDVDMLSGRRDLLPSGNVPQGSFAGFSLFEGVVNASHLADFNSIAVTYSIVSGEPRVGFCFHVDLKSTPCRFTGMVVIFDAQAGTTFLGYFIDADLHSDLPTILATGAAAPSGDIMSFFCDISAATFELSKSAGLLISSALVSTIVPSQIAANGSMGFIWLPNSGGGVHQAKFTYGNAAWDIS